MRKRWIVAGIIIAGLSGTAIADTGGSMGGGSWGGGGGGGGYSGGGGGGYSSSGGSYSYSSSGGSSTGDLGVDLVFLVIFGIIAIVSAVAKQSQVNSGSTDYDTSSMLGLGDYTPMDAVDVSVIRIAVDGRARKFVQSELKRIAGIADTKTAEGRATMLREVAMLLRRLRDAWVYGGAVNEPMRAISDSKTIFDHWVDDARARFREETIRNEQGTTTSTAPSQYTPRSDEGAGIILVSIVVAARRELFTVTKIGSGDDLRQALESASQLTPDNLVAIEIVWQPSEDSDRLSSMELEVKYPRPDVIPIQNALVGKTFCTYCGGPFPAELVSCPHCGAPAPGRDAPPVQKAA
jgi:uncharacterized membrane protein